MKAVGLISLSCVCALGGSLLLARVHPFGDAGLYKAAPPEPSNIRSPIPAEANTILREKCGDCHSLRVRAPFYGHFAPISWLMERDIVEARQKMNLTLWDSYPADRQQTLQAKIIQETKAHDMPPLQYRLIHRRSSISDADLSKLTAWTRGVSASSADGQALLAGDAIRGKEVFEKRCTGCHSLTKDGEGPRLHGVFGRTSGTVPTFEYSPALKSAHIAWDEGSLEKWLADPDMLVPGNNMEFHVAKPQERVDLVTYFKQESGK